MYCTDKWIFRIETCREENIVNKPTSLSVNTSKWFIFSRERALVNGYLCQSLHSTRRTSSTFRHHSQVSTWTRVFKAYMWETAPRRRNNLVPRVFSLFKMAVAREKTLAHSRSRDQISNEMDMYSKWKLRRKGEKNWVRDVAKVKINKMAGKVEVQFKIKIGKTDTFCM